MSRKKENRAKTVEKPLVSNSKPGGYSSGEPAPMPISVPVEIFPCREEVEYRVQVQPSVWNELMEHSRENAGDSGSVGRVELCGVLVGRCGTDANGSFLLVEQSIRGVGAKNEGAQVTFTHATWDHIHHEMDTRYPDGKMVGWYHTHPGFGIFLSDMDTFIQENFFNQPFQVALVIDPVSGSEGLFAWVNARIQPLSRFWVGTERRQLTRGAVGNVPAPDGALAEGVPAMDGQNPLQGRTQGVDPKYSRDGMFWKGVPFDGSATSAPFAQMASKDVALLVGVFLVGMLFSLWGSRYAWQNGFREEARSQIREMMALLAGEMSRKNDLALIDDRLAQVQKTLADPSIDPKSAVASTPYTVVQEDVGRIRLLIANLASATVFQEGRVRAALSGQSADGLTVNERLARLNEELVQMRGAVAMGYFLQVKLLLAGLDPNNPDPGKTQIGRQIMQFALTISPVLENNFRQEFPWLFNPVAKLSDK